MTDVTTGVTADTTNEVSHSPKFDKVKDYYKRGLWSKAKVRNAVAKNWITADEYEEITGEVYPDPNL